MCHIAKNCVIHKQICIILFSILTYLHTKSIKISNWLRPLGDTNQSKQGTERMKEIKFSFCSVCRFTIAGMVQTAGFSLRPHRLFTTPDTTRNNPEFRSHFKENIVLKPSHKRGRILTVPFHNR